MTLNACPFCGGQIGKMKVMINFNGKIVNKTTPHHACSKCFKIVKEVRNIMGEL